MFQLEQRYIVPQHGNTVRLLPSALPPRLTNEARGANRAAHERWDREIYRAHTSETHVLMQKNGGKTRESSSALLFRKPVIPPLLPSHVPQEQPAGYFSDKETGKRTRCTSRNSSKSSSDGKTKKGRASARFSRAGTV